MKCPRCQHENPPQSRFCFECGAHLAPTCSYHEMGMPFWLGPAEAELAEVPA